MKCKNRLNQYSIALDGKYLTHLYRIDPCDICDQSGLGLAYTTAKPDSGISVVDYIAEASYCSQGRNLRI